MTDKQEEDSVLQPIENVSYSPDRHNQDSDSEKDFTASSMSFQDLLKHHHTHMVWGFSFGKEVRAALNRNKPQKPETTIEEENENPGPSKAISEQTHKTPHSTRKRIGVSRSSKRKSSRSHSDFSSPQKTRRTPLPLMSWADSTEVWLFMVYKEEASLNLRNPKLFEEHNSFMPRMRAILLDWLMEVCEVYHLRRVTYYLSVDYFDKFLSIKPDVPKNQLQLVGVTCLFLAAKLEEVYPPRLTEFSYVCDGACSPEEILSCELLILNSLGWDLSIMTPSDLLNLYMQIHFQAGNVTRQKLHLGINKEFFFPQYSGYQFARASQLMDMFSLDPGFLKFSYSTIAAAAMYFMYGKKAALTASGLSWKQLQPCAEYMAVFYHVVRDSPDPRLQSCKAEGNDEAARTLAGIREQIPALIKDENHSLQTHVVSMDYFEKSALIRLEQMGLKVEKTYVKKKKDDDEDAKDSDPETENEKNNKDYICMYDVEKLSCDAIALSDEEVEVSPPPSSDAELVLPDDSKGLLTFDEILDGIVKCNEKNIAVQLDTCKELLEEEENVRPEF